MVLLIGALIWFLWHYRETWLAWVETLLAWYYALQPHPAAHIVEQAIRSRGQIDGKLFAAIMRPVPGDPIEQRVRAEQAHRLAAMARVATEDRLRELEHERAKAVQDAAFIHAQDELRSAAEAHELAQAKLDALRKWRASNVG